MIARIIDASIANRIFVALAAIGLALRRLVGGAHHARRRTARPVRRAGGDPLELSRPGAADRRGPGDLSAGDDDAVRAGGKNRARLLVLRRQLRLCHFRGRDRSLLGALARSRISQPGAEPPARWGCEHVGPRRHRRRMDLRICARRPQRRARPRGAEKPAGLVFALRAQDHPRHCRGRQRRRDGEAISGRARPLPHGFARGDPCRGGQGDPGGQPGGGRLDRRDGRGRIHGPRLGLSGQPGGFPRHTLARGTGRGAGHAGRCGPCPGRP